MTYPQKQSNVFDKIQKRGKDFTKDQGAHSFVSNGGAVGV